MHHRFNAQVVVVPCAYFKRKKRTVKNFLLQNKKFRCNKKIFAMKKNLCNEKKIVAMKKHRCNETRNRRMEIFVEIYHVIFIESKCFIFCV